MTATNPELRPGSPISPAVLARESELAKEWAGAQPFRHVVIDDFLTPSTYGGLCEQFPDFSERNALNEHGEVGRKSVRERVRTLGPAYSGFDDFLKSRDFLKFMEGITGIPRLLYDPLYLGGGTHENRHGQGLQSHIDFNYHPKTGWHRRLNLILFLNETWDESWGGNLTLERDPWDPSVDDRRVVQPMGNRAVIFETTEASWHGFPQVRLPEDAPVPSRRSFAIYLYTKDRPPEETRGPHSTVYVPPPLPERFAEGYTLNKQDVRQLNGLLESRQRLLRWLYDREVQMAETIEVLRSDLDERNPVRRLGRAFVRTVRPMVYRVRRRLTRD